MDAVCKSFVKKYSRHLYFQAVRVWDLNCVNNVYPRPPHQTPPLPPRPSKSLQKSPNLLKSSEHLHCKTIIFCINMKRVRAGINESKGYQCNVYMKRCKAKIQQI